MANDFSPTDPMRSRIATVAERFHSVQRTFDEYAQAFDEAVAWLSSVGAKISGTRIALYRAILTELAAHQRGGTLEQFAKSASNDYQRRWVNARVESAQLIRRHAALQISRDAELMKKLRKVTPGHELTFLEPVGAGPSERDLAFELDIAADFVSAGYEVDFGHSGDVMASRQEHTVYSECKRPRSLKRVPAAIKKGLSQLNPCYASSTRPSYASGILVLSIGRLINPKLDVAIVGDLDSLGALAGAEVRSFMDDHHRHWQRAGDARTLGAVVILDLPGVHGQVVPELAMARHMASNQRDESDIAARELLTRIFYDVFSPAAASP